MSAKERCGEMASHLLKLGYAPGSAIAIFPVGNVRPNLNKNQWKAVMMILAQVFGGRWPSRQ